MPIRSTWHDRWDEQEVALRHRMGNNVDKLEAKAHDLKPLELNAHVRVQNQSGNSPRRWERTGVVVGHNIPLDKYWVKMDGSRRVTERNRKFLRLFKPHPTDVGGPGAGQTTISLPQPSSAESRQAQQQQKQQWQAQEQQKHQRQDMPEQYVGGEGTRSPVSPAGQARLPASPAGHAWSPATPEFATPGTSPAVVTPARPATGRTSARRSVSFNLEQGEEPPESEEPVNPVLQAATQLPGPQAATQLPEPQAATQPPGRQAEPPANGRPRRVTRRPAWQVDFDMSAEAMASEFSSSAEYGDNGLVGVNGHGKDDLDSVNSAATPANLAVIVTIVQRVLDAMTRGGA